MELLEKVLDGENIGNAINKVVGNKGLFEGASK